MTSPIVVVPLPDRSDEVGDAVSINLASYLSDYDSGDVLTYSISGLPSGTGLGINASTGIVSGTPTASDVTASPIAATIRATDDGGNFTTISLSIAVTGTGGGPVSPSPPDSRGIFLIWYGKSSPELDKSYVHGGQGYTKISNVYDNKNFTSPNYSSLTADIAALDVAVGGPKPFTLQVNAQKDASMRDLVWYLDGARATYGEQKVELDGDWISCWWDANEDGLDLMKSCFLAGLLAYNDALTTAQKARCIGIRVSLGAIAVEGTVPSTAAGQESDNYTKGADANATRPADYSSGLALAAKEAYYQFVIDTAFPSGTGTDAIYPMLVRMENYDDFSTGLKNDLDAAWNNNRMGTYVTSWAEEPYNTDKEEKAIKAYDICKVNGNLRSIAEAFDEPPGNHATVNPTNYSVLQRKYWGILFCLHVGYTWIYLRDEYTALYGSGSENQQEWKATIDFANTYAGWHADPANAPGAFLALREGNRFTSADAGGGNYTHHMSQVITGGGDRGTELWAGNQPNPSSDYVGRPSSTTGSSTIAGTGQRQSLWAFSFSTSEVLKIALDSTFAAAINGENLTIRVHYLDLNNTGSFQTAVFGANQGVTNLTNTDDWIVKEFTLLNANPSVDSDGAHIVITPSTTAVVFHMVEVVRG